MRRPTSGKTSPGCRSTDQTQHLRVQVIIHQSEHFAYPLGSDRSFPEAETLIQDRQRIPHAPVGVAGNEGQGIVIGFDTFGLEDLPEPVPDGRGPDSAEIEALEPRHHGCRRRRNFLGLGGGEHEYHTRRRLLENLEQRVPRLPGEHMSFVYDVDLVVPLLRCRVHGALAQIARILHAPIARSVDLHHVDIGGAVPHPKTVLAVSAGFTG